MMVRWSIARCSERMDPGQRHVPLESLSAANIGQYQPGFSSKIDNHIKSDADTVHGKCVAISIHETALNWQLMVHFHVATIVMDFWDCSKPRL